MGKNSEGVWSPDTYEGMSVGTYLSTRISSLRPPMLDLPNPIKLIGLLNAQQWAFFAVAFFAWTWDAFDFFTVSLTVSDLAKTFGKSNTDITWGITLVLMFRSVGSILFGIAADRYGRKWPFVVNNLLFIALELSALHTLRSPTPVTVTLALLVSSSYKQQQQQKREWSRPLSEPGEFQDFVICDAFPHSRKCVNGKAWQDPGFSMHLRFGPSWPWTIAVPPVLAVELGWA
ncbi:Carboxylic acid transporterhomolog-like protein [Cladobotryum mycophilum]|uniref:Carboxylic acid transporterhomolog-like protein n=1 Tax=Cladobotryum mycophilum TaxID=491253 RepID=A0ABR0SXP3_9HYPO